MRKVIGCATLALFFIAGAYGQTTVAQKIATVDMQSAMIATNDGQKASAALRAKFGPKDQDLQKRQADLQAKQEQFRKTQNTMSDAAKAKASGDIDTLGRALQRETEDAKADMEQDEQRMSMELGTKMLQVVNKYAADNKFNLVFNVSGDPDNIRYGSNGIDITREVIALYNQASAVAPGAAPAATPPSSKPPAAKPPATK